MDDFDIELEFGCERTLTLDGFQATLKAQLGALRALDVASGDGEVAQWTVVGLSMSSPARVRVRGVGQRDPGRGIRAARKLHALVEAVSRGEERPAGFTDPEISAVSEYARIAHTSGGGAAVTVPDGSRALVARDASDRMRAWLPAEHTEYGTVVGSLDMLKAHGSTQFAVWDEVHGTQVTCRMPAGSSELFEQAYGAFRRRVAVTGTITYRAGVPSRVEVEGMETLPGQGELPRLGDLPAIDITDGEDAAAFIRRLRDAI